MSEPPPTPPDELALGALRSLEQDRNLFITGPIDDAVAARVCAQLMMLDDRAPGEPISMHVNSPGGVITSGMAIYDTMQFVSSPIRTVCLGTARSLGSLLVMAGAPGRRIALPNASFLVHQPSGGYRGTLSDLERHAEDILRTKRRIIGLYARHTGQPEDEVERMLDRDTFLDAEEAKVFGLVDHIVANRAELRAANDYGR